MGQLAVNLFQRAADGSTKRYQHCTAGMYYMVQAAEAGHILSMFRLAQMFYFGHVWILKGKVITSFLIDNIQAAYWLARLVAKLIDSGFDILGTWDPQATGTGMQRMEVWTGMNVGDLDADWVKFRFKKSQTFQPIPDSESESESESEDEEADEDEEEEADEDEEEEADEDEEEEADEDEEE
jgi:hypothetical protein